MDQGNQGIVNEEKKEIKSNINLKSIENNKYVFFAIALIILIVTVYLRIGMLSTPGLFEPDGYYYYTMIKQSIAQGFILPKYVNLSGYPIPSPRGEDPGLIYMATIPYFFLRFLGINILDIMRMMGPAFGVLDAIAAYFLAKYLSKSRLLGLLAMLFVALSSGNIARTAALVYRGDTWVSFFIMIALIALLAIIYQNDKKKKYIYTIITGFLISLGFLIWTGGVIVPELFMLSAAALTFYAFIIKDNKLNFDVLLMLVASFIAFLLDLFYTAIDISYPTLITGNGFFILFLPIVVSLAASYFLIKQINKGGNLFAKYFGLYKYRLAFVVIIIGLVLLAVISIPSLNSFITNGHAIYEQSNIGITTQELQRPSMPFLWSSFGFQLILAPLGIILFIFLAQLHGNETKTKIKRFTINVSIAFVVMLVYFVVMFYLQEGAIRFNSMLSLPIAIFSAYAVYILYLFLKPFYFNISNSKIPVVAIFIGIIFAIIAIQFTAVQVQSTSSGPADGVNPLFFQALEWMSINTPQNARILALWPDGSLVEAIGNRTSFMDSVGSENAIRIEQYHSYLFNGTPDNAYLYNKAFEPNYILARNFWYDEIAGIAIEGNLTNPIPVKGSMHCSDVTSLCTLYAVSLSKSNPGIINGTIKMQYNSSGGIILNNGYGTSNIMIDGLAGGQLVFTGNIASASGSWGGSISFSPYSELLGNLNINGLSKSNLTINGNVEDNLQDYGFTPFANYSSSANSTSNLYIFTNPPPPNGNGYKAILVMKKTASANASNTSNTISNTPNIYALLGFVNSNKYIYLRNVEFMNVSNYDYSIMTNPSNTVANYTLLIQYSGTQIDTAVLVGPKLFYTNIYKMLDECGFNKCALSNGNVTAQLVYANPDSKIIKMNYT